MFYPTGIDFCSFRINTCCNKLFRKESMTFINLFGHLPAYIGQMEKVIFIHCEKAAILQSVDPVSYTHLDVYKRQSAAIARSRFTWLPALQLPRLLLLIVSAITSAVNPSG